eukprot:1053174-Amphidinium_carterae.1
MALSQATGRHAALSSSMPRCVLSNQWHKTCLKRSICLATIFVKTLGLLSTHRTHRYCVRVFLACGWGAPLSSALGVAVA